MSTTLSLDFWKDICTRAFNDDVEANDFVLFVEGCRTQREGVYAWTTTNPDHEQKLQQLGCQPLEGANSTWTLSSDALIALNEAKRNVRSEWHTQRQLALKKHLDETLALIHSPLDITNEQRLALTKQFVRNHETDLGTVPFLRGLLGFLKYQLNDKRFVAEWKMSEYVLTQNNEEAMESYIRLLKGILGFQLAYQDDDDNDSSKVAIDIEGTPKEQHDLIWRMNPDFDNHFIHELLSLLPKEHNATGYQISTHIPRNHTNTTLIQWIYELLTQCLSFLHK